MFFQAFRGLARCVTTVSIPGDAASQGAGQLYDAAHAAGLDAYPATSVEDAMLQIEGRSALSGHKVEPRILICGSLHLAGVILRENA
jgi:dihydrofolate synthase/folylpolyglutamate synthase